MKQYSPEFVQKKVRSLGKLSTLPHIAAKVMELVENPKTSASTLGRIISTDQVLTARLLKLANSAYYGFPRKISTLNLAIVVLGFNALRDLVLSISVVDQFSSRENDQFDSDKFWRHSLIVAMGSKMLSRQWGYSIVGEVFVGGLLHDIGYLVLLQHFPDLFQDCLAKISNENKEPYHIEQATYGFTHADVGSWLAEGWNLPDKLVRAIRYHHEPQKLLQNGEMAQIIHFANLLSYTIGEGNGITETTEFDYQELEQQIMTFSRNNLSLSFYQDKLRQEAEKVDEFLNVLIKGNISTVRINTME